MRTIRGGLFIVAGLALSTVPIFGKKIQAVQTDVVSRNNSSFMTQGQTEKQGAAAASTPAAPEQGAHMDHKSKHGGTFFMALDNVHHLEGISPVPPGLSACTSMMNNTKPLKAVETRKASGTVQVGES